MGRERRREGERTKLEEVKSEIWEGRGCRSESRGKGKGAPATDRSVYNTWETRWPLVAFDRNAVSCGNFICPPVSICFCSVISKLYLTLVTVLFLDKGIFRQLI